jgi:hypothetical protein
VAFESRFGAAAEVCSSYRREYPRELFDRILAHVPSGRRRPTLALGAGTGKATSALIDETTVRDRQPLTPEEFAGYCRSTSYGSAYGRSLADPESYWCGLECRFCDAWPHAKIQVDMSRWLMRMRKL